MLSIARSCPSCIARNRDLWGHDVTPTCLQIIAAKETGSAAPVQLIDGSTFMFKRAGNLFMVAVTRNNANVATIFHFMTACVDIFKGYFNGKFDEETLRNNFSLVYELLDGEFMRPQLRGIAAFIHHFHDALSPNRNASTKMLSEWGCHRRKRRAGMRQSCVLSAPTQRFWTSDTLRRLLWIF